MKKDTPTIKIYVACLASYNNGILHGAWINAAEGESEIWKEIKAVLATSPIDEAQEWAIHDHEGFGAMHVSEYTSVETIVEMATFIERYGELGAELTSYLGDMHSAQEALEQHYIGEYETVAGFAQELTEDTITIPDNLSFYIDYEKMARDIKINDLIVIETGYREQHLFWSF